MKQVHNYISKNMYIHKGQMFTGIISAIGKITKLDITENKDAVFHVSSDFNIENIKLGDSISCSGICLTVTGLYGSTFTAMASLETLRITTAKQWQVGTMINLERALRVGDELGGHMVSGHVDDIAVISSIIKAGSSWEICVQTHSNLMRYIARKGSITLDGISLTVNSVSEDAFMVNVIPYTFEHTTLQFKKVGDALNIEVDLLARYVLK